MTATTTPTPTPIHPDVRDTVFAWSTPAPNWDGSIPKPWRVARRDELAALLLSLGYDNARAYVEGDHGGKGLKLWVGLRDNRDVVAHSAELAALGKILRGLGFTIRFATGNGRTVGIRVYDHSEN